MAFYDLDKEQRIRKYVGIQADILSDLKNGGFSAVYAYFNDDDTYIRKAAYLAIGRLYNTNPDLKILIINTLEYLLQDKSDKVRQTAVNSAGEIAMTDFEAAERLFEKGLGDKHHTVKNAVQGSLKKAGERNPEAVIPFCRKYINDKEPEIRRQVAHGLELRGRTHPEDILPVLKLLQFDTHRRVRPMLIHIFGQISYKKGCLEKVTEELLTWDDKALINDCFNEIIEQHRHINNHFKTVATLSYAECADYISRRKREMKL